MQNVGGNQSSGASTLAKKDFNRAKIQIYKHHILPPPIHTCSLGSNGINVNKQECICTEIENGEILFVVIVRETAAAGSMSRCHPETEIHMLGFVFSHVPRYCN